jgi:hypothetical protein
VLPLRRAMTIRGTASEDFVAALCRAGFVVYRRADEATILERGARAVVVPTRAWLEPEVVSDLRRMAGVSWRDFDELLGGSQDAAHSRR